MPFSKRGIASTAYTAWSPSLEQPLRSRVHSTTSARSAECFWSPEKVQFLNDADAFLLREIGTGAARCATEAMGITLGTAIGSAFAVNGQLVTSGLGVSERGKLWKEPYADGIVEDLLSTRALQSSYVRLTGLQVNVEEIAMAAETDPTARKVFDGF